MGGGELGRGGVDTKMTTSVLKYQRKSKGMQILIRQCKMEISGASTLFKRQPDD